MFLRANRGGLDESDRIKLTEVKAIPGILSRSAKHPKRGMKNFAGVSLEKLKCISPQFFLNLRSS